MTTRAGAKRVKAGRNARAVLVAFRIVVAKGAADTGETWIQVAKVGEWKGYVDAFGQQTATITEEHLASIVAEFDRRENDLVLDYEHASMSGGKNPAAGWITAMEIRPAADGAELWASVKLTTAAAAHVEADEYRFTSPVIMFDAPDRVSGELLPAQMHSVALTNTPFFDGMAQVQAARMLAASRRLAGSTGPGEGMEIDPQKAVEIVTALMQKFGVATAEELVSAVEQLAGGDGDPAAVAAQAPKSLAAARKVIAHKDDLLKVVTEDRDKARGELAAITASQRKAKIDAALEQGRIRPEERETFERILATNPADFDTIVASRQAAPTTPITKPGEKKTAGGNAGGEQSLTPAQDFHVRNLVAAMGWTRKKAIEHVLAQKGS